MDGAFNLLLQLPTALSCGILSDWMLLRSVVRLDSAFCNRTFRNPFLQLLQSNEMVHHEMMPYYDNDCGYPWLTVRRVKSSQLFTHYDTKINILAPYLLVTGSSIRNWEIEADFEAGVNTVIAEHCRQLKSLTIVNAMLISEHFRILSNNPSLTELHLSGVFNGMDHRFQDHALPALKVISIRNCDFDFDTALGVFRLSNNLERVNFGDSDILPHNYPCARIPELLQHCTLLKSVGLSKVELSNAILAMLVRNCAGIVNLDLSFNTTVTDAGMLSVVQGLKGLRSINTQSCESLTDASIHYLSEHCSHSLQVVYLSCESAHCLTTVSALLTRCRLIHTLGIETYNTYSAVQLTQLFSCMGNIRTLQLADQMSTDAALHLIPLHCTSLRRLDICNHKGEEVHYTEKGLLSLVQGCPQLQSIVLDESRNSAEPLPRLCKLLWNVIRPRLEILAGLDHALAYDLMRMPIH